MAAKKQAQRKASNQKNQQPNRAFIVLLVIGLVGIAVVGFTFINSSNATDVTGEQAANGSVAVVSNIAPAEYQAQFESVGGDHYLLDVRTPGEFDGGHIPGADNISVQTLQQRLAEVPQDKPIVVYCRSGNRSAQAARILQAAGYETIYDLGGIIEWQAAGLPVE